MASLEELSARGAKLLFDPSPLVGDIPPQLRKRVLEISQVLTPNESELEALGGLGIVESLVQGKNADPEAGSPGRRGLRPGGVLPVFLGSLRAGRHHRGGGQLFGALLYAFARG